MDVVDSLPVIPAADGVVCMRGPTLERAEERVSQSELVVGRESQKTLAVFVQLITYVGSKYVVTTISTSCLSHSSTRIGVHQNE